MRTVYQHGYHAGNVADMLKHSVLVLLLRHMCKKSSPFAYAETHAGAGVYDLTGGQSLREHTAGFGRLRCASLLPDAAASLISIADRLDSDQYPGSPHIAATLCRSIDSLLLAEREEEQFALLCRAMSGDERVHAVQRDGYEALRDRSLTTPKRRGLVLMDPPYQFGSDTERLASLVQHLSVHWSAARVAIWYPLTRDAAKVSRLRTSVAGAAGQGGEVLAAELSVPRADGRGMLGSGMLLVKPPYGIEEELRELLPALGEALHDPDAPAPYESRVEWVTP